MRFIERHSDVPKELRDFWMFQREVNELVHELLRWEKLELFAIHEVGHEIYFRKAGFAIFTYVPPRVIYRKDDTERPFKGRLAEIKPQPDSYTKPEHEDWLFYLAKGYAAGGECSRNLTTTDYGGDTIDRQLWNEMCADCYKDSTLTENEIDTEAEDLWSKAQNAVGNELKNSMSLRVQVRTKAKHIIPLLFPWTKYA